MTLKEWLEVNGDLLCGEWIHLNVTDKEGEDTLTTGAFKTGLAAALFGDYLVVGMTGFGNTDTGLVVLALVTPTEEGDV